MKLCTVRLDDNSTRAARLESDELMLLDAPDVGALLARPDWRQEALADGQSRPLELSDLAPVVLRPPKVVCVGLNYAAHIAEMGHGEPPAHPTLFAKFAISLIGARDDIILPSVSRSTDWEVELGVVIGSRARHVAPEAALRHVAGYTVVNDISVRDYQRRTSQYLQGKTHEATTPVGPWLVTDDELPPGAAGLEVRCEVDGEIMQRSTTDDMLFDVAALVSYLSDIASLEPGDLIATGTPSGVGASRDPQAFLRPGQVVRTVVEEVGELINRCVTE